MMHSGQRIATDESFLEAARHGTEEYPFQFYLEDVWEFDLHCVDWHWHPELEFVYMRRGEVDVSVAGEQVRVPQGGGMFINSRVVHRFTAQASATMPNFVFSPALLAPEGSLVYRRYVQPVLASSLTHMRLDSDVPGHADVLRIIREICDLHERGQPGELRVLRMLLEMWELIIEQVELCQRTDGAPSSGNQARLQIMLQYIHDNYSRPITLQDIADSVYISKSSALQIFHRGIGQSPVACLIDYRLKAAAALLRATERSVSSISMEVGFSSAGYFCRKFRELFGLSPNAYRRERRG